MNKEQELRLHGPFKTDDFASYIYGSNDKIGGDNPVLEIRGWGYLTGNGHGALGLSHAEAVAEQKRFASFVVDALNAASPPAVAAGGVTGRNAMVVELSAMLTDYYPDDDDGTAAVSIPAKQLHRWLTAALAVGDEGIRPDLLAEMAKHPGWSIERGYRDRGDDEGGPYGWCVYDVRGGRSDLEWDLIGFGETPHEALSAAVAALPTPPASGWAHMIEDTTHAE